MITVGFGFISGMMIGIELLDRDFSPTLKWGVAIDLLIVRMLVFSHDKP